MVKLLLDNDEITVLQHIISYFDSQADYTGVSDLICLDLDDEVLDGIVDKLINKIQGLEPIIVKETKKRYWKTVHGGIDEWEPE